jgi:hypothetical protein
MMNCGEEVAMSNQFLIASLLPAPLGSFNVLDIPVGGSGKPPAEGKFLQLHPIDGDGTASNQLWNFVASTEHPGYFNLRSAQADNLGKSLVVDIHGDGDAKPPPEGTLLDVFEQKSENKNAGNGYENQLWTIRTGPPVGQPNTLGVQNTDGFWVQALLKEQNGNDLVIDILGGTDGQVPASGSSLQVYKKKSTDRANQLWQLISLHSNTFTPEITVLSSPGGLLSPPVNPTQVTVAGKGFAPGAALVLNLQFSPPPNLPETVTSESLAIGVADLDGTFNVTVPWSGLLIDQPGTQYAEVTCYYSFPNGFNSLSAQKSAAWDGLLPLGT